MSSPYKVYGDCQIKGDPFLLLNGMIDSQYEILMHWRRGEGMEKKERVCVLYILGSANTNCIGIIRYLLLTSIQVVLKLSFIIYACLPN